MGRSDPTIADENQSAATAFAGGARYIATPAGAGSRPGFLDRLPWTMGLILVGFATVASCIYLPLREESRKLGHELGDLRLQAKYVQEQVAANAQFLERVHVDPTLANRLIMRMTNTPIPGTEFLDAPSSAAFRSSPFQITRIDPPAPQPPYATDLPPLLGSLLLDFKSRLILLAAGIFLMASGVILGTTSEHASATA
jgi:hypothetical protein